MKIRLYTLPLVSLAYPNLSVPTLLGYLKNKFNIDQRDLSTDILDYLLTYENLINELEILRKDNIVVSDKVVKKFLNSISYIKTSIKIIRNKDILTFPKYIKATNTINDCLRLLSYKYNCSWSLSGFSFHKKLKNVYELITLTKEIGIFDLIFDKEIEKLKSDYKDIIGLSVTYAEQLPFALRFCQKIKEKFPKVKIVLGGSYVTHADDTIKELIVETELIDVAVFFNGELTFEQVINSYQNYGELNKNIPNIFYRGINGIKRNFFKKSYSCINDIIPSYEGIDLDKYLSPERVLPMMLSSGCKHGKCSFCSHHYGHGAFNGYKNEKVIVDELKYLTQGCKAKNIYFVDAYLTVKMLLKISNIIISNAINANWMTETRIDPLFSEKQTIDKIRNSGCVLLSFGIESFNESTLKSMYKEIDVTCIPAVMDTLSKADIITCITLISGFPTEDTEQMRYSLESAFLNENIDLVGVSAFGLVKQSPMYLVPKKWGISHMRKKDFLSLEYDFRYNNVEYDQNKIIQFIDSITKENNLQLFRDIQAIISSRVHYFFITKKQIKEIKKLCKEMISDEYSVN